MKLSKIAFAVASTLAIASGAAFAGQIGSSSVTVASEVIVTDAQIIRAPSNVYTFAGDVNAQTNQQLLQLQYTLSTGTWGNANLTSTGLLDVSATTMLGVNYIDASNTAQVAFPTGSIINAFVTTDRKTLVFNVNIPANVAAANLLRTPAFTINANANGLAVAAVAAGPNNNPPAQPAVPATPNANAGISGLFTVVGKTAQNALTCLSPDSNIDISFKHFTTHNSNTTLSTNATPDAEHLRPNSSNLARLLNFVQNQTFTFVPATSNSRADAAFLNQRLGGENFVAITPSATVAGFANNLPAAAAPATRHYFGRINLNERARGVDLNFSGAYGAVGAPAGPGLIAADFAVAANATLSNGVVEIRNTVITINLPTALPVGTVVTLRDGSGTANADFTPVTTVAGQTALAFTATTAAAAAAFAAPNVLNGAVGGVHVFGVFPGNAAIPQVSGITVTAALNKSTNAIVPASGDVSEQSLSCVGALAGIGGGIKIDIRNYASKAKFPAGDFASYVRLINNSESSTADLFAQLIYADGTYGPWGALPALTPRAVVNYSNAQLEALLVNTPAAASPFAANTVYTQTAGTSVVSRGVAGTGDRVRFLSNSGTTLRIQSFMLLPTGNLLDTTNAQGVDFENTDPNRTPLSDGQPISQDAINGIAR